MSNKSPLVSVITACYNASKYIGDAIDSILSQTYENFEMLIVDDGSIDNSVEIIKQYKDERIKLICQENQGPGKARNNALAIAKGKYVAILDADDVSLSNRLELQVNFLEKNSDCCGVGGGMIVMTEEKEIIYNLTSGIYDKEMIKQMIDEIKHPIYHGTMMFNKEVLLSVGGYVCDTAHAEDYFMIRKINKIGFWGNLSEPLIYNRLSYGSLTNKSQATTSEMVRILQKKRENIKLTQEEAYFLLNFYKDEKIKDRIHAYLWRVVFLFYSKSNNKKLMFKYLYKALKFDCFGIF